MVPNTTIYTSQVTIHTSQEKRRVEFDFTVGYAYDIRKMTKIIEHSLSQVEEILQDPPPQILCWGLGSTSLEMRVRWWIHSQRSQEVISRSRAIQAIKEAFDANDIDPTDPQLIYYQKTQNGDEIPEASKSISPNDINTVIEGPSPPEFKIAENDPEAKRTKKDSKDATMLPNE